MSTKIGLLVGREWSFPPAFIEEVAGATRASTAEFVQLGAPAMDEPCPYASSSTASPTRCRSTGRYSSTRCSRA